jgi:hypothetical protein
MNDKFLMLITRSGGRLEKQTEWEKKGVEKARH